MTPLSDVLAQSEAPSLFAAGLRTFAALALLGAATWAFLRWRKRGPQSRREIRILDRAALSRGAGLALVAVAGRRLLLGISANGVRLLTDVDDPAQAAFDDLLEETTSRNAETTP